MLFVSLTLIVSATYYISVTKIQARGALLNIAEAKHSITTFESFIGFAAWSPGTSSTYHFEDSGGTFKIYPNTKNLLVNITDNNTFYIVAFNSSVGKAVYELPPAETAVHTFYLKGDRRAIINQTAFTMAQIHLSPGTSAPELTLAYRPLATMSETNFDVKPVNTLRLYIISFESSATLTAQGELDVKSTCVNVTSNLQTYNFSTPINTIFARATLDERSDIVALPMISNVNGSFLEVETLVCHIKLERIQRGS